MNYKKRMDRDERRKQILESALNVFVEKGYNGSTTVDIAKRAEISEVTLFRYFDSKKQIFMEAIEPVLLTSLKETIKESENMESKEKLKYILKDRIQFVSKNREAMKLILMESQINPELADFNLIDQITKLLRKTIEEIGVEKSNEDFLIRLLLGSILSFLYLSKLNNDEIDSYVKKITDKIMERC